MYEAERQQLERRRKIMDMMAQQAITPQQTQMVSGRAVPQGWGEGLSRLAQAMMAKQGYEGALTEEKALDARQAEGSRAAMEEIMPVMQGKEAEYMPQGQAGPPVPPVEPNIPRAAMMTATDPRLQDNKPAQNVIQAMMKAKMGGANPYSRAIPTTKGWMAHDVRGGSITPLTHDGKQLLPPQYDVQRQTDIASGKASGKAAGEDAGKAAVDLPGVESRTEETLDLVDSLTSHSGMKDVIGFPDNPLTLKGYMPGTDAADFRAMLDQVTGRTFMEIYPTLKGGGQITEIEGEKGQSAINRMRTATSETAFLKAAADFKKEVTRLREITRQKAGKGKKKEKVRVVDW